MRTFTEEPDLFDLALLDHGMADITGLELAQRFRHIRPGFPVVVYTGYFDAPTMEQLEAAGIGGVMLKPLRLQELEEAIEEALGESGKDQEWAQDKWGSRTRSGRC